MDNLYVIKIGGNVIDDEAALKSFLSGFARIDGRKILVHGGGKLATSMGEKLGIHQQLVEGRRMTDAETLKIVTMVYAGYINKNIVAGLQAHNCNAIGLSGADGNLIQAHKRISTGIDYGFAGDIDHVNTSFAEDLLSKGFTMVVSPITHDGKGQLLNTNADTIASTLATAFSKSHHTTLVYCFEKPGVLENANDDSSVIARINRSSYAELKKKNIVSAGMIPKLDNAFAALDEGVSKVVIGKAGDLAAIVKGTEGTQITNE
jgi:acetylglutamate kinase